MQTQRITLIVEIPKNVEDLDRLLARDVIEIDLREALAAALAKRGYKLRELHVEK